jgi:hypothetical protein
MVTVQPLCLTVQRPPHQRGLHPDMPCYHRLIPHPLRRWHPCVPLVGGLGLRHESFIVQPQSMQWKHN